MKSILRRAASLCFWLAFFACVSNTVADEGGAFNPNDYSGTDSERIASAVADAAEYGGRVVISPRRVDENDRRGYWLLDSAILLPGNTTLILDNCVLKLSDKCRDNFIRSANVGIGVEKSDPVENIKIIGVGAPELIGADHPRATGDSGKKLGERAYGTDAGKEGESQTGDWRNIGVLLANVRNFQIENITIRDAHAWSISLEKCSEGIVRNIRFDSQETRTVDGEQVKALNVDGLDLRKGCHDIAICGISGRTGDDIVALTAINPRTTPGGLLETTEVCDFSSDECLDIYNISISDVMGYSTGGHQIVRLLNASGIKIYRVTIQGVIDTSPEDVVDRATIRIGDANPNWGGVTPLGDTFGILISNVHSRSQSAVRIAGSLVDSVIRDVVNYNPKVKNVDFESGIENVKNVRIENFINAGVSSNDVE